MRKPTVNPKRQLINFSIADIGRLALAIIFLIIIYVFVSGHFGGGGVNSHLLIIAAVIGGYMAMNIGANDVANNVGPAYGAGAINLLGAIVIAVICESAGALIAGGDVTGTIKKNIISPDLIPDVQTFIWLMMAALLAAALWLNIATAMGAPVSTTHSIVGGVLGAGVAAGGFGVANWPMMGKIAASWVISPVMGGAIAAGFLLLIKRTILYKDNKRQAAQKMVPVYLAIMGWAFTTYLVLKGLKHIHKFPMSQALLIGLVAGVGVFFVTGVLLRKQGEKLENSKSGVDKLFVIPLIVSAAFLSFAHGANDVANAVGPLAAINTAVANAAGSGTVTTKVAIPLWVMAIGALGIATGLALYGPKLIKTVGQEITELDMARGFCVALAAAITVIIASQYGLPVSSTHIAVGAVFGVGFLREHLQSNYNRNIAKIRKHMHDENEDEETITAFLARFEAASVAEKKRVLRELKEKAKHEEFSWAQRRRFKKAYKAKLIERSMLWKIVAAWVFTVPLSGVLAAALYYMIRGYMLP